MIDIIIDLEVNNKSELLEKLVTILYNKDIISNKENLLRSIYEREKIGPTSIGNNIAIPHGKDNIKEIYIFIAKLKKPILWEDINKFNVSFVILFVIPNNINTKINLMCNICKKLGDDDLCKKLISLNSKKEIIDFLI